VVAYSLPHPAPLCWIALPYIAPSTYSPPLHPPARPTYQVRQSGESCVDVSAPHPHQVMSFPKRGSEHRPKLRQALRGLFRTQSGTGKKSSHHVSQGGHTVESRKNSAAVAHDGSRKPVPTCDDQQPTNREDQAPNPSFWDRAYQALAVKDPGLVENYERLLSEELKSAGKAGSPNRRPLFCLFVVVHLLSSFSCS
jgi:hypothetical protein